MPRHIWNVGLSVLLTSCVGTKHLYVAPDGADTNPGTENAPFLTLARADAAADAGSIIHVAPGSYQVDAPTPHSAGITTIRSGTKTSRIRFISDVRWGAKIIVSGPGIAWHSLGNFVDIEGFDISGTGRHGILADGTNLIISNNFIHDLSVSGGCTGSGGAAIDTNGGSGGVLIKGNVVRNIGHAMRGKCNTVQGIYIANPNNVVVGNIVSGVAAAGIQQWHGATISTIMNNTVFHCKIGILIGGGDSGALPEGSSDNFITRNIIYDNITYGIVEGGKVGSNNRYVDNLVHSSGTDMRVTGHVSGTIFTSPPFVDYRADGTGNYHLKHYATTKISLEKPDLPQHAAGSSNEVVLKLGAYDEDYIAD